jgi:prolyl 4-hydroxylase
VETIEEALSPLECEFVIALGEPYLKPSVSTDATGATLVRSVYRTSAEMSFFSFQEDYALRWLQWRMVDLVGSPLSNAEHTVLLRYLPGQEYRVHRDYLPPSRAGNMDDPNMPGQRIHTVFCYLSEVEQGGETAFPLQQLKVEPRLGRIVHFKNVLPSGEPDSLTLHAGLPVVRGEKWLATLWTRERRIRNY